MGRTVEIVEYDPSWPELYEQEAVAIRGALAGLNLQCFHIGSTAIPGMSAKAVIDILLAVESLNALSARESGLQGLGIPRVGNSGSRVGGTTPRAKRSVRTTFMPLSSGRPRSHGISDSAISCASPARMRRPMQRLRLDLQTSSETIRMGTAMPKARLSEASTKWRRNVIGRIVAETVPNKCGLTS